MQNDVMQQLTDTEASVNADIWAGDLFGRMREAAMLQGYIESVGARPSLQEDHKGYTISVDANYGIGKSYFLQRLSRQLALTHPVAFVDAWKDDLTDEPLTAIAATLKIALADLVKSDPEIQKKWDLVSRKTGEIAKVAAKGLLKKALSLAITESAVNGIELLIDIGAEDVEKLKGQVSSVSDEFSSSVTNLPKSATAKKVMADRISAFEEGKAAISELKASLNELVSSLESKGYELPIVIIVDELDRCRPNYAIKLFEEVKHLFDVPGIVFVFGVNSDQLSCSVSGQYGPGFDGKAYLRRFINRKYTLSFPDSRPLVTHLANEYGISGRKLQFLPVEDDGEVDHEPDPFDLISRYMSSYSMTARDAFQIMDILHTCCAITGSGNLFMPLLLPMIIGHVRGLSRGAVPDIDLVPAWSFKHYNYRTSEYSNISPQQLLDESRMRASWNRRQLMDAHNNGDVVAEILAQLWGVKHKGLDASPAGYVDLLHCLDRFE